MAHVPQVSPSSSNQDTRLLEAARSGDVARAKKLIDEGVSLDATDSNGATALIFGAMVGNIDVVKMLIEAGADPQIKDKLGYNAYKAAMFYGDFRGATMPPHDEVLHLLKEFEN